MTGSAGRCLLVFACLTSIAHGAGVPSVTVSERQGRYRVHSEVHVEVPAAEVRALLTDFNKLPSINPDLKRVVVRERLRDGGIRMEVTTEFCLLVCLPLDWVQDVYHGTNGDIAVTIVSNGGDFRDGSGRWRLLPSDRGTRIIFDLDLTPKFWMPPVLGAWLMERKLTSDTAETARGLERLAPSEHFPRRP